MGARGLESLLAELAGAVRRGEWGDDQIALPHRSDGGADRLHDSDELVAHPIPDLERKDGRTAPNSYRASSVRPVEAPSQIQVYLLQQIVSRVRIEFLQSRETFQNGPV